MADDLGTSMLSIRHKIVFVGDPNTGKTSLMHRLLSNTFKEEYESTIGVDFYTKTIKHNDTIFKLQLWDTAGQEKYKALIPSYIRGSSIIFILYDITNDSSFENVNKWLTFMNEEIDPNTTKVVLIGNKNDLEENRKVKKETADEFAKKSNIPFYEISVKTASGVNNAFYNAISLIDYFNDFTRGEKLVNELIEQNSEVNEGDNETAYPNVSGVGMKVDGKIEDPKKKEDKKGCAC
ncbi:MAG: GTP-binding protein [archaeon]|nr:GTP-binding protein [archaeon]